MWNTSNPAWAKDLERRANEAAQEPSSESVPHHVFEAMRSSLLGYNDALRAENERLKSDVKSYAVAMWGWIIAAGLLFGIALAGWLR